MATGARFDAVSLPLRGGWRVEWRRKGCTTCCVAAKDLPAGWLGVAAQAGPIALVQGSRGRILRLRETTSFLVGVEAPADAGEKADLRIDGALFTRTSREGSPPAGEFQAVNHLGMVGIAVVRGGVEENMVVEVVSAKFEEENDFRKMTEDIAAECQQLLLAWNLPTGLSFAKDPTLRQRLLLEQFLYVAQELDKGRLERWVESIRSRPHERLWREASWRPTALARSVDHLRMPGTHGRGWRLAGPTPRPTEVLETIKRPTLDTPPNRFIKFALTGFAGICRDVIQAFSGPAGGVGNEGPAAGEARALLSRLQGQLGNGFFREIGEANRIPIGNPTLQKREGYRDILRAWLLAAQAARLDWDGRDDVFNATIRDVAALYEYWLFFILRKVIADQPDMREVALTERVGGLWPAFCEQEGRLQVRLKRGVGSLLAFEWGPEEDEALRIHFCFDRTYSPTQDVLAGGAYSRSFRPDFSLVIFPASFARGRNGTEAEQQAEAAGRIAYLHFDAKYRVDALQELFPADRPGLLDEEETGKTTNTYQRADLYKMHTYNDAIRRTVGSFVLYPGNGTAEEKFSKYHELLPGLGAFAVSPSSSVESGRLVARFLGEVLAAQRNRFSQLARIRYWTHDTIQEKPGAYHAAGLLPHARPPKDTTVVLGFIRADEDPEEYRSKAVYYCHAGEWTETPGALGGRVPGAAARLDFDPLRADLLAIHRGRVTEPWLAKVVKVCIVSAEDRAGELQRPPESMKAAYYYRFKLGEFFPEVKRDVRTLVGPRGGRPVACTLAALAECAPR